MKKLSKKAKLPRKYPNGGFIKKAGEFGLNYLRGAADTPLTMLGLDDVISDDQYTGAGSKFIKGSSAAVGAIGKAALPVAANIIAPGSGSLIQAGQGVLSNVNNEYIQKPEEVTYNQNITQPQRGNPYAQYSYEQGGQVPDTTIEVEGNELEVSKGKILKDFKNKASHEKGGYTYKAISGNMIIPSKLRNKYLEGDKITRNTIEANLKKDQIKRERETPLMKNGGYIKKYQGPETGSSVIGNDEAYVYNPNYYDLNFQEPNVPFINGNQSLNTSINIPSSNPFGQAQSPINVSGPSASSRFSKDNMLGNLAYAQSQTNPSKLGQAGYYASMFAPIAHNLIRGTQKPQILQPENFQNPYESEAVSALRSRKIDMAPIQNRLRISRLNALKNAKVAGNTGSYLSNAAQIEANSAQSQAEAEMQAQDYTNRYRGDLASGLGQFGSQRASRNLQIQDINDRNRAARNAMLAAAAGQTSQAGQGIYRDDMRFDLLEDYFPDYGYQRGTGYKYKR